MVHHALCAVLEPALERLADPDSFACRVGKGSHAAVRRAQRLVRRHGWYVKVDVRHHFETVCHARLLARLSRWITDPQVLALIAQILAGGSPTPGRGLPIGSLTSQHLGNFVLGALDHHARHVLRVDAWIRYMDDAVAFVSTRERARDVRTALGRFVQERLDQELKHEFTVLAPAHVGLPFLGFRIWPRQIRLDRARRLRLARKLRALARSPEGEAQRSAQGVLGWASMAHTVGLRRSLLHLRSGSDPAAARRR